MDGDGNGLGIVTAGTSAHRKQEIRLVVAGELHALTQLFHRGIGHHVRILNDILAVFFQNTHDRIVNAVLFDGTAAVD